MKTKELLIVVAFMSISGVAFAVDVPTDLVTQFCTEKIGGHWGVINKANADIADLERQIGEREAIINTETNTLADDRDQCGYLGVTLNEEQFKPNLNAEIDGPKGLLTNKNMLMINNGD